jgi:hypothetical protein
MPQPTIGPVLNKPRFGATLDINHPHNRGLSGFWAFNDGTGTNVADLTNAGQSPGTIQAGALLAAGDRGPWLPLDGTTQFVSAPDTTMTKITSTTFTLMCSVILNANGATDNEFFIEKDGGDALPNYWLYVVGNFTFANNTLVGGYRDGGGTVRNFTATWPGGRQTGTRYVLTFVSNDATSGTLYINGQPLATSGSPQATIRSAGGGSLLFGKQVSGAAANPFFNGKIEWVRVYNGFACTAEQVFQIYERPYASFLTSATKRYINIGSAAASTTSTGTIKLNGTALTFDPALGDWTGVIKRKSRADAETLTRNVTYNWGFVDWDPVILRWGSMPLSQFLTIDVLHKANNGANTYTFDPGDGSGNLYTVEIVSFVGTPFGPDVTAVTWMVNVELVLKVMTQTIVGPGTVPVDRCGGGTY